MPKYTHLALTAEELDELLLALSIPEWENPNFLSLYNKALLAQVQRQRNTLKELEHATN